MAEREKKEVHAYCGDAEEVLPGCCGGKSPGKTLKLGEKDLLTVATAREWLPDCCRFYTDERAGRIRLAYFFP